MKVDLAYAERQLRYFERLVARLRQTSDASDAEKESEEKREIPPAPPIERKEAKEKERTRTRTARARGEIPSIDEIGEECRRIGCDIDPMYFWNYYQAKEAGWPRDWKAALVVWTKQRTRDGRVKAEVVKEISLAERERRRIKELREELEKKFK